MKHIIVIAVVIAALGYLAGPECYDGRGAVACLAAKP